MYLHDRPPLAVSPAFRPESSFVLHILLKHDPSYAPSHVAPAISTPYKTSCKMDSARIRLDYEPEFAKLGAHGGWTAGSDNSRPTYSCT